MTDNDESIDQAVFASRPNPTGPEAKVIEQHRARLDQAVADARKETPVGPNPSHGPAGVEVIDLSQITARRPAPRRRHAVLAVAAVAAFVVGTVALVNQQDSRNQLDTEIASATGPDSTDPTADAEVDPSAGPDVEPLATEPLCGTEFPIDLIFADATVVHDGPLEAFGAVMEGQLVKHWTQGGASVELRWPEEPKPIYGEAPNATLATTYAEANTPDGGVVRNVYAHAGALPVGDGDEMAAILGLDGDALRVVSSTHGSAAANDSSSTDQVLVPAFGLGSIYDGTPDEGCGLLQARFVTEDDAQALIAIDITNPQQTVDVNPLVINQIDATDPPTAVVACEGAGTEPGVPAFVDQTIAPNTYLSTPIEAFQRYLDSSDNSRATSGYTEITNSAGVTYAHPFDDNRYTVLVNVTNSTDGWAVTQVRTSGC